MNGATKARAAVIQFRGPSCPVPTKRNVCEFWAFYQIPLGILGLQHSANSLAGGKNLLLLPVKTPS